MRRFAILAALGAALLAACAPRLAPPGQGVHEPRLVIPNDSVLTRDGRHLPLRIWEAQREGQEAPRAVIVALHGFNDYSNAFTGPARWWAEQGVTTYAYDQRGFGKSELTGLWPGVDALTGDLKDVVRLVRQRHPGAPLYVVGESMGGAVAMAAMAEPDAPEVEGLVLSAPAVWGRATMNPVYRGALWFIAHTLPWTHVSGSGLNIRASDNIEMLRALGRDPLVIKQTRTDAVYGLVNLMDAALEAAPRLAGQRVLLLYGANDQIIPRAPIDRMLASLDASRRVMLYPEGWHMLFRDLQGKLVWQDTLAWMLDRAAPLPSGHERTALPLF